MAATIATILRERSRTLFSPSLRFPPLSCVLSSRGDASTHARTCSTGTLKGKVEPPDVARGRGLTFSRTPRGRIDGGCCIVFGIELFADRDQRPRTIRVSLGMEFATSTLRRSPGEKKAGQWR